MDNLKLEDKKTESFNNLLNTFNMKQLIDRPTRITDSCSSLLDLVLVSAEEDNVDFGCEDVSGVSDHFLVFCRLSGLSPDVVTGSIRSRCLRNIYLMISSW